MGWLGDTYNDYFNPVELGKKGINSLFGGEDYGDPNDYLEQMKPMLEQYYNPYIDRGNAAGNTLDSQYSQMLNNPQALQEMLGSGYKQSPGYQYSMDSAMNAGSMAAAAGGRLGTSSHQQEAMKTATGLADQDYWNYYNQNANLFNSGLSGTQSMYNTGYNASNQMAQGLGNLYGSQANLAHSNNQSQNGMISSLLGAGIGAAGYALGGPGGYFAANAAKDVMMPKSGGGGGSSGNFYNPQNSNPANSFFYG